MWIDEVPMQLADSYFLADMIRGTRIAEEDTGPGGVYVRLEEMGYELTSFVEELNFRIPTPEEAHSLQFSAGVPVIDLIRVAHSVDQPVRIT